MRAVQAENLVVGNYARIHKVQRADVAMPHEYERVGQKLVQNRHGVWKRAHFFITSDFGDEVARIVARHDRHSNSQIKHAFANAVSFLHQAIREAFYDGIARPKKIRRIAFFELVALLNVGRRPIIVIVQRPIRVVAVVIGKYAPRPEIRVMYSGVLAQIREK